MTPPIKTDEAVEAVARAITTSLAHQDGYEGAEPWPLEPDGMVAFLDQQSPNMLIVARAAIAAMQSIEGWRLVPEVLPPEMIDAAADTPGMLAASLGMEMHQARGYGFAPGSFDAGSPLHQAWSAMLSASPAPPLEMKP